MRSNEEYVVKFATIYIPLRRMRRHSTSPDIMKGVSIFYLIYVLLGRYFQESDIESFLRLHVFSGTVSENLINHTKMDFNATYAKIGLTEN